MTDKSDGKSVPELGAMYLLSYPEGAKLTRHTQSDTTSKSYNRAIKNFKEWANTTWTITGPNRQIVTPKRLYQFLQFIDHSKRKSNGERYSFLFYEQHVTSIVTLYEEQKAQFPSRPKLSDTEELNTGEWEHPRDKNVKNFLKMIKKRYLNGMETTRVAEDVEVPQQRPTDEVVVERSRIDSIEEHLRIQAESLTRTNALLSLYHNDLSERHGFLEDMMGSRYEDVMSNISDLKLTVDKLGTLMLANTELLKRLAHQDTDDSAIVELTPEIGPTPAPPADKDDQEIPKLVLMDNKELTVQTLFEEYTKGYRGQLSLKEMEAKYGTRWRVKSKNNKTILRRLKIGQLIERTAEATGLSVQEMIQELTQFLTLPNRKLKSVYWLSENLPQKFQ